MTGKRIHLLFWIIPILGLWSYSVRGQQIIINSKGERIIIYPDGSWRPVGQGDSLLVRQYLQRTETLPREDPAGGQDKERTKAETIELLIRQWNEIYGAVMMEEKKAQDHFRGTTNAQFKAGQQLSNAEANKELIEPDRLDRLKDAYDASIRDLKMAKLRQKKILSMVKKAEKINQDVESLTRNKVNSYSAKFQIYLTEFANGVAPPVPTETPVLKPQLSRTDEPVTSTKPDDIRPSTKEDRMAKEEIVNPENLPVHRRERPYMSKPYECRYAMDTLDDASGRKRVELSPDVLFTHTDPDLRPYFKDKDLITCSGWLSRSGPYVYLIIEFQIASSHSQNNFGSLQSGSLLRFKLMDGDFISLHNLKSDRGRIDPYSGHTIFTGQYALGKEEIKKLSRSELDKMRVLWGTGYEDYEIYNVDFLIHQLHCLQTKK